jgi:hypothetical protein
MNLANTKSQLAKLMATENLTVQHQNVPTASFNVKTRVLTLPIFEDGLSVDLYDLMTSHEVGHALWTPEEGWHSAVCDKGSIFKGYLNVIEDARIEKKIKSKFPGLAKAYRDGYADLLERDFFGIRGTDIEGLNFIDRINLHFKLGTLVNLHFEGEEAEWVEKIKSADTFEEVIEIATALFDNQVEKAEQEQEERGAGQEDEDDFEDFDEESDEDEIEDDEDEDETEDDGDSETDSGDDEESDENETWGSGSGDELSDEDGDEDGDEMSASTGEPEEEIRSTTDENFRSAEESLIKQTDREYRYWNFADLKSDDYVIPVDTIIEKDYANMFSMNPTLRIEIEEKLKIWKNDNTKIINYMVKEFEMKKKADEFKRASTSKSGELDMGKVFSYKYNDDLFKRVTTVTGGKNHGFVMLLDWSGSMAPNMLATIDQLLNLVLFCRKVKIPFDVYAFTQEYRKETPVSADWSNLPEGTLVPSGREVSLMQLFESKMKIGAFNEALLGLFAMRECLANGQYYRFQLPGNLQLSGTPLDDSLLLMPDVIKKFVSKNRVQIANLVVLTDGDSNNCGVLEPASKYFSDGGSYYVNSAYTGYRSETVVTDTVTKTQERVSRCLTDVLISLIGKRCNVNTIGFFVMDNKPREIRNNASRFGIYNSDIVKKIRDQKFIEVTKAGYDSYFLIPGGSAMETKNVEMDSTMTKNGLKNAFMKNAKSKTANRVLLSRLMEIAA